MSKKISARKQLPKPDAKGFVKITQRQFEELKISLRNETRKEIYNEVINDAIAMALLAAGTVLWNDWGKLVNKKTRMKNFSDAYIKYLEHIDKPTHEIESTQKAFEEQAGLTFISS